MSKPYEPKNLYIALDVDCHGFKYAYVWKTRDNQNLASLFESLFAEAAKHDEKIMSANVWPKSLAESTVDVWNKEWKSRGCYYWDHFVDYDRTTGQPIFDVAVNN